MRENHDIIFIALRWEKMWMVVGIIKQFHLFAECQYITMALKKNPDEDPLDVIIDVKSLLN